MDVTRGAQGELVIAIDGAFDAQAARRLTGWLHEVPLGAPLVLDFTRARDLQDFGLAAVARDLAQRGNELVVRGLGRHQRRMLRYFGVNLELHADVACG